MANVVETFADRLRYARDVTSRRRWLALGTAAAAAVVSMTAVSFFHNRYQATAKVYVDTQTVLKPLMESLAFQPDIEQQVSMLARTLISRPNVEKLVAMPSLQLEAPDSASHERLVSKLMSDIKIVPAGAGNLYDISYRGSSPDRARHLVEATVNLFVNSGAGAKKRDSQEAGRFIDAQIQAYESKLVESENRLKDFKVRNFGISGVSNQDYFTRVSALTEEVSKLRVDLSAAEQSSESYRRGLASENPQLPPELAGVATPGSDAGLEGRLEEQKRNLDDLLRRFTENHPDVVNARRNIAQLEAEVQKKRAEDHEAAKSGLSGSAATSPVYQKLRMALAESDAQVASLRSQVNAKQALLDDARAAAGRQPQAEAELVQLNRDYDIIRKNYDLMVARRESAALGVKLDESSQLAEFRIVEPPREAAMPVFPSQWQLGLIALLLSLAAGVGAAIAADLAKPSLDSIEALRRLSGRPVLGSVSLCMTQASTEARRADLRRFSLAFCVLVLAQGTWLAWAILRSHSVWVEP